MRTRLEGHEEGRTGGLVPRARQSSRAAASAWGPPMRGVETLADRLAVPNQDRADQRVGADPAAPPAASSSAPSEVHPIVFCNDGRHD